MSHRTVSPLGLAQIKLHEGFRGTAAPLPDGRYVVGYGHVCETPPSAPLSKAEAGRLLEADLAPIEQAVSQGAGRPLTPAQLDALVSFAFSIGLEAYDRSDVLRRVRAGDFAAAACAMEAWRKTAAGGKSVVCEALVRRRAAEKAMMLSEGQGAPSAWLKPEMDHAASILGAPSVVAPTPTLAGALAPVAMAPIAEPASSQPIADDIGPVRSFKLTAAPRADTPLWRQAAFACLTLFGLALVATAAAAYLRGAPFAANLSASFLLGAPGVAASLAGLFFLTRPMRPVFARV
ncbi:MAG: glycoside hydrolase family protein [Hydrogenophilaceae bacterium]|jgi:lysozyme|nr:glycoside hydrolase family protein [Hydrogenophilaceae bacterium]